MIQSNVLNAPQITAQYALTLDINILENIINSLIYVHRNGTFQDPKMTVTPEGLTLEQVDNQTNVLISYGFGNTKYGTIKMKRGQFEIFGTSLPTGPKSYNDNVKYNHPTVPISSYNDYKAALQDNNVGNPTDDGRKHFSALVNLTSECCRSTMIFKAMKKLIKDKSSFPQNVWDGIALAIRSYNDTCSSTLFRYDIYAGQSPWNSLTSENYKRFFQSTDYNKDEEIRNSAVALIKAVESFYASDPEI